MSHSKCSRTMAAVVTTGILCAVAAARYALVADPESLYPPAPFEKVPIDFPRMIENREGPPRADKAAWNEHVAYRKAIDLYLTEGGAIRRANKLEREAVVAARRERYAAARELAAQVLERSPESSPGLLALAAAEAYGDGNLPRGLYLVREARRRCERRGLANPSDTDAREWYLRALVDEYRILDALDRRTEQLIVVDRIESIYEPMPQLRIWPQIKLRRYVEAGESIRRASRNWKTSAMNSQCALAAEMQQRVASFEVGARMIKERDDSPLLWANYGLTCAAVLRPDEAERAYLRATSLGRPDFAGTAYNDLAILYLQQGRVAEAIDAYKRGQQQRASRLPHLLQQDEASMEATKAMILLVAGRTEEALRSAQRGYELPDRGGSKSDDDRVLRVAAALATAAATETRLAALRESGAWTGTLRYDNWLLARKIRKLADRHTLVSTLRPYLAGGPGINNGVPSWLRVSVIRFLPAGVAREAIRQARATEDHRQANAYLDAAEAEAQWIAGDAAAALELARTALEQLPQEGEKLLRARVALIKALAARELGDMRSALPMYEQALRDFPAVYRLFGAALPVAIHADERPDSQELATKLGRSPRLVHDQNGFSLSVSVHDGVANVRLLRADGSQVFDESIDMGGDKPLDAAGLCAAFHERLMSPDVDLTQADLGSLDGSPFAAQARETVDKLLDPVRPNVQPN